MQQSTVAFIALARELLDKLSLSLALERSGNVSSARTRGGAKANPVSTQFNPRMWVGLTRVQPGFAKTDLCRSSADAIYPSSTWVKPGFARQCGQAFTLMILHSNISFTNTFKAIRNRSGKLLLTIHFDCLRS